MISKLLMRCLCSSKGFFVDKKNQDRTNNATTRYRMKAKNIGMKPLTQPTRPSRPLCIPPTPRVTIFCVSATPTAAAHIVKAPGLKHARKY
jgi:hypothetical protein